MLLYMQVGYEILKINHGKRCKLYPDSFYAGSFDECKIHDLDEEIKSKFNGTVPYMMKQGNLCRGSSAKEASDYYKEHVQTESLQCPQTCQTMSVSFGMPKYKDKKPGDFGKVRLYFNDIIKETEDFVSYDLLR